MHSIKKAARRQAWYNDDQHNGSRTYNPFGRVNPRSSLKAPPIDQEAYITHVSTETEVETPIERRRHEEFANTPNGLIAPNRSGTWNGNGTANVPDTASQSQKLSQSSATSSAPQSSVTNDEKPNGITETSVSRSGTDKKVRKRKFFGMIGSKKSGDSDDDDSAERAAATPDREEPDDKKKSRGGKHIDTSHITLWSMVRAIFGSWINVLLVAVPVGIALGNIPDFNYIAVFVVNFIAIVPLAAMLSYSTEELAMYIGEVLGGLLNASFGNAVELIVSIIALTQKKVLIVQTSLVGSMLSNLLLVLGMCFFAGGINRPEQNFNVTVAQTAASLLALAIGSLIIPTAFSKFTPGDADDGVTPLSRGTAVLLLIVYGCYLLFQLRTHVDVYNAPSEKVPKRKMGGTRGTKAIKGLFGAGTGAAAAKDGSRAPGPANGAEDRASDNQDDENKVEEEEVPQLTRLGALVTLAISTVFIALCAEYMVSAIDQLGKNISQEFIGLILLPIVGNAAEHATAVTVAIKDKMDLSIGVAVGSSLQIALLVFPLMILLNWFGVGSPSDLSLDLDGFLVAVLFISIILVNYLIQDGKSHWLEGVMLMVTYLIIAVGAYFYPVQGEVAG